MKLPTSLPFARISVLWLWSCCTLGCFLPCGCLREAFCLEQGEGRAQLLHALGIGNFFVDLRHEAVREARCALLQHF